MPTVGGHGGGRRAGTRPTRAEREQRITTIHTLLVQRVSRKDISRYLSEKTSWNIDERTIDRYVAQASRLIREAAVIDRNFRLGLTIFQLDDLYSRTHRVQDYKTALAIKKEEIELLGLAAPKRMEVTGADGSPPSFIAIMPEPAKDNETWSQQCREELAARQASTASTPSGGA